MKKHLILLILFTGILMPAQVVSAAQPSDEQLMDMFRLSGATDVLKPLFDQISNNAELEIRQKAPNLPHQAYLIIKDELRTGMDAMMVDALMLQAQYYKKHLTAEDVDQLIAIYSSPVWKKNVQIGKQYIQQEFKTAMQAILPRFMKQFKHNVDKRLRAEGFIKKGEGI